MQNIFNFGEKLFDYEISRSITRTCRFKQKNRPT